MLSNNLQDEPLTAEEAKSHFKNHFDVINENIEKITVMQMQQKNEYHDLFEKSNWQTKEHKQFLAENDQERQKDLAWAHAAFDKYEEMNKDFTQFKKSTNTIVQDLKNQYEKEMSGMKIEVDEIVFKQRQISQQAELIEAGFKSFEANRAEITTDLVYLKKRVLELAENKFDETAAVQHFSEVHKDIKANRVFADTIRNDLLTLENYVERY